ncbi:membrane-bound O-acyltransferase domain-containing protein 2-like [Pecten maximus]|uniref:membrane-bound O-acyltransferase domain-containing protein 2-like n=1 Tax=Pecten maximus TaxID=6579 RepID=UPI001458E0EA|nr:membrane-bound O-acyltransferase domain-containing protein 2-like [Pecten maximus]
MVLVGEFYQGSELLKPLCDVIGLPIDQINFLASFIIAFSSGILMRKIVPAGRQRITQRHVLELSLGLALGYFCFGYQLIHLVLYTTLPYLLVLFGPRQYFHTLVFAVAFVYIVIIHAYRLYYDYGGFSLDVTGPMMLMTQKVTSVAFSLHDGMEVPDDKLSEDQRKNCIRQKPSFLEYYSYMFSFHNIMAGPLVFYTDYLSFIDGSSTQVQPPKQDNNHNSKSREPSPNTAMVETSLIAIVYGILMLLTPVYAPVFRMADDSFLYETNILYRNIYMILAITLHRSKYYFAWKLGELSNLGAGLGFRGYDDEGKEKWDLLTNIKIWQLETSNSLKVFIDSWNLNTVIWFRRVIYDRTPPSVNTLAVFVCSGLWHGLYPGYYVTFFSTAFAVMAARLVRRNIRHHFQTSDAMKFFYDCVTFIATKIAGAYLLAPFCLLEFTAGIKLMMSVGFHIHILSAVGFIYFTFINPSKKKRG